MTRRPEVSSLLLLALSACGPSSPAPPPDSSVADGAARQTSDETPDDSAPGYPADTPPADATLSTSDAPGTPAGDSESAPADSAPRPTPWGGICPSPVSVNFGAQSVGLLKILPVTLAACGDRPTLLTSVRLLEDRTSPDFALDLVTLPGTADRGEPTEQEPLVVLPGGPVTFRVRYVPDTESPKDRANQAIPDLGVVRVTLESPDRFEDIELRGVGVSVDDAQATIAIGEGEQVVPQTVLHLVGDQSFAPSGPIAKWEWTVDQPIGSQSLFWPSATFPNPTFEANVVGSYLFRLTTWDAAGSRSFPDEAEVLVVPDEVVHVELLWNTPGDPDQTDSGAGAGADLGLHFLHPSAFGPDRDGDGTADGWFGASFDCWAFDPNPSWGSFDPSVDDDPRLAREDPDGAGPELVDLDEPEDGALYRIGVHARAEHDYGPSWATVRVYLFGALAYERSDVKLHEHDFWDVGTLAWPAATFTPAVSEAGGEVITPGVLPPRER